MTKIIECIPNFSEGRDPAVLTALRQTAGSVPGAAFLDMHVDADHNRSVITLLGSPDGIGRAAYLLAETAVKHIDLNRHAGVHPRIGAVDVIPFVPIRGATMEDCVALSRQVAEQIAQGLHLPAYLYEYSATHEKRKNLADIRRGGFEGLAKKMTKKAWEPDFGACSPHPTAGAVAVGAREILIAFNINLDTPDIAIAQEIAKAVRGSSGGLPYVKAMGVFLQARNQAQVSMNLVNYKITPVRLVFERVREEAEKRGVRIVGSELVGLMPSRALADCAADFLQLENYDFDRQIIEHYV